MHTAIDSQSKLVETGVELDRYVHNLFVFTQMNLELNGICGCLDRPQVGNGLAIGTNRNVFGSHRVIAVLIDEPFQSPRTKRFKQLLADEADGLAPHLREVVEHAIAQITNEPNRRAELIADHW